MFFHLLLFAFLGVLLGILTGLTPGLHVNTVSLLLLGAAAALNPYLLTATIISMAITHTFFDFIPSIYLGAPEPSTALTVLPGHKYLLKGRGQEAIYLTVIGGLGSVVLAALLFPLFFFLIPFFYNSIHLYIHWVLMAIATAMILTEPSTRRKITATLIFFLSGALGFLLFSTNLLPFGQSLFPAFTGLFGISTLLISINRKTEIPEQKPLSKNPPNISSLTGILKGLFSGVLVGTLPGVGAAQATILSQQITRRKTLRQFLISVGAINTIVALFSLISLATISKARSGAAVAVEKLLTSFGLHELLMLLAVALLAAGVAPLLLMKLSSSIASLLHRVNYKTLSLGIIIFLTILTFFFTGPPGLLILFTSTSIGLLAPLFGAKRSNLMGVLMLPLILFYLGL